MTKIKILLTHSFIHSFYGVEAIYIPEVAMLIN